MSYFSILVMLYIIAVCKYPQNLKILFLSLEQLCSIFTIIVVFAIISAVFFVFEKIFYLKKGYLMFNNIHIKNSLLKEIYLYMFYVGFWLTSFEVFIFVYFLIYLLKYQ